MGSSGPGGWGGSAPDTKQKQQHLIQSAGQAGEKNRQTHLSAAIKPRAAALQAASASKANQTSCPERQQRQVPAPQPPIKRHWPLKCCRLPHRNHKMLHTGHPFSQQNPQSTPETDLFLDRASQRLAPLPSQPSYRVIFYLLIPKVSFQQPGAGGGSHATSIPFPSFHFHFLAGFICYRRTECSYTP